MLEYFEGILFLTTNRQDQFDEAFRSRIHLTIKLPELGDKERQGIWKALVSFNHKATDETSWTQEMFETLGKLDVNVSLSSFFQRREVLGLQRLQHGQGRLIKNLLRTATYHARSTQRDNPLSLTHLYDVIKVELSSLQNIGEVLSELEKLITQPKHKVEEMKTN